MASNQINFTDGSSVSLKDSRFIHLYADINVGGTKKTVELTGFQNGEAFSWEKTENDSTIAGDFKGDPVGVINHSKIGTLTINTSEGGLADKILFQLYKTQGSYEIGSGVSAFDMRMVNDNWGETAKFFGCLIQKLPAGHASNSITPHTWTIDVMKLEDELDEDVIK